MLLYSLLAYEVEAQNLKDFALGDSNFALLEIQTIYRFLSGL